MARIKDVILLVEYMREKGDDGKFVQTVSGDDILNVFEEVKGPGVAITSDVADICDCSVNTARLKLQDMEEQGLVRSRCPGRDRLWWAVENSE